MMQIEVGIGGAQVAWRLRDATIEFTAPELAVRWWPQFLRRPCIPCTRLCESSRFVSSPTYCNKAEPECVLPRVSLTSLVGVIIRALSRRRWTLPPLSLSRIIIK